MKNIFNVTEYGVRADRPDMLQTEAIQKVIDIAAKKGGTVYFPQGHYCSGSLFFKKGTLFAHYILINGLCRCFAGSHGEDDGCGARYGVTACINTLMSGKVLLVNYDTATLVGFKSLCR